MAAPQHRTHGGETGAAQKTPAVILGYPPEHNFIGLFRILGVKVGQIDRRFFVDIVHKSHASVQYWASFWGMPDQHPDARPL